MQLYDFWRSGNCYKVRLTAALLGIELELIPVDLRNPPRPAALTDGHPIDGHIPLLVRDDGSKLAESLAILCELAEGTSLMPRDPRTRSEVMQWLSFDQGRTTVNLGRARVFTAFGAPAGLGGDPMPWWHVQGDQLLDTLDHHLAMRDWLAGRSVTIADIANYAYTHLAEQGGFDLSRRVHVGRWMRAIEALPGYVPLYEDS